MCVGDVIERNKFHLIASDDGLHRKMVVDDLFVYWGACNNESNHYSESKYYRIDAEQISNFTVH